MAKKSSRKRYNVRLFLKGGGVIRTVLWKSQLKHLTRYHRDQDVGVWWAGLGLQLRLEELAGIQTNRIGKKS